MNYDFEILLEIKSSQSILFTFGTNGFKNWYKVTICFIQVVFETVKPLSVLSFKYQDC